MTIIQAIILGTVQGVTEFLPVSSSGHLVIFQHLFGYPEPPIFFDILVHAGTLLAVVVFFFNHLKQITLSQLFYIFAATIPAALAGIWLEPYLDQIFNSLAIVSIGLIITGTILLIANRKLIKKYPQKPLNLKNALVIGLLQSLAILPGVSRSGTTVSVGVFQNLSSADAFTFSFLLSIPAILGALILQLDSISLTRQLPLPITIAGFISSTITGMVSLIMLKKIISSKKLNYFGYYCYLIAGLILISYLIGYLLLPPPLPLSISV